MEVTVNGTPSIATPTATLNGTAATPTSHNVEFLVAVVITAISVSIIIAILAKCQVVRRYLASYRHTRLRESDSISQGEPAGGQEVEFSTHRGQGIHPLSMPPGAEEDDDGFIEDNYIAASERARAERAAENMEDTEEEEEEEEDMDEIVFTIA